ncbi:MAG: ribosomal RNA small subunit methyltransferase A [Planctomycetaceae bacterium]|nr:ribosomal RNA small subunit methyltransferase A [Planctomycetaceae bacterium]
MSPEPQTQSRIKRLLGARGLNPRRDLGQNFLIDLNLVRFVAEQAELSERDVVLEVGPGMGSLTGELAPFAGAVVAVEYDRNLYDIARTTLAGHHNVTLINSDALQGKHSIAPGVLDAVREQLSSSPERRLKLVANLPYNVATPVMSNLVTSDLPWERMVVTIQYELAERMLAAPSSADYSTLSVWLQSQCDIEILRKLPPSVFWPRPNVDSAIVKIVPNPEKRERIKDRQFFHEYLRTAFQQRRKQLRGLLVGLSPELSKSAVIDLLAELGCGENVRAEELAVTTHVELSNRIRNLHRDAAGI